MDVQALQNALGHAFVSKDLLQQALTHRSHSTAHNERLEFLGDSVLNCVIAALLFDQFARIDEGDLSRLRANLVKQQSLYEIAQRLELSPYLRLGEGELKSGGFRRPSILADTVEALFGAIFLDAGFDVARAVIKRLYLPVLETVDPRTLGKDAKTLLQEYLQGRKIALPVYTVVATHGAAHSQEFEVECAVPKLAIQVLGGGGSRRAAEQAAARKALEAAQSLAVAATKKTRRAKPAQLSLQVAVEQSAAGPRPEGQVGTRKSREPDGSPARATVERPSTKVLAPIEPARIVAQGAGRHESPTVKVEERPVVGPDAKPEPSGETGADPAVEPREANLAGKADGASLAPEAVEPVVAAVAPILVEEAGPATPAELAPPVPDARVA